MAVSDARRLPMLRRTADETALAYEHPLLKSMLNVPGLSIATGALENLLEWGARNSLWVFPMATSCCGIELMSAAASRVDLDRMGTIVRATPRQADVMVIAGTITTKMAPRVKALWEQMPEPKWAIAMGSCAISGDFYRNLYPVVPGIDTVIPIDVYIPGCPPNPEALMHGLLRLQERIAQKTHGKMRDPSVAAAQLAATLDVSKTELSDESAHVFAGGAAAVVAPEIKGDYDSILNALGVTERPTDGAPIVPAARHAELARALRGTGYKQLVYIVATHFTGKKIPERFEVAYGLRCVGRDSKVAAWRVQLQPGESLPSLVGCFAGADLQEREQFDLVGVRFDGHPDLRRIMMSDAYEGHPLRKDFAADAPCAPWR